MEGASPPPLSPSTWPPSLAVWGLLAALAVLAVAAVIVLGSYRGWWLGSEEASFRRDLAAVERELSALEESLRPTPVIGLASARDRAARDAWEDELRRRQEPPDDDDGFLADGNSDDERLRASVRRRGAAPPASSL